MTDELHHLLLNHPLIGVDLPLQENATDAFVADLKRGFNMSVILPQLFEARASCVLGTPPYEQVSELLSGLLIGAEVASMHGYATHQHTTTPAVGAPSTAHYQQASQATDCDVATVAGDITLQAGIGNIAHAVTN